MRPIPENPDPNSFYRPEHFEDSREFAVPAGYHAIATDAFAECPCEHIHIPRTVTKIKSDAFGKCPHLERITVDPFNPVYTAKDGILYERWTKTLFYCPPCIEKVEVPGHIRSIGHSAFRNSHALREVILPDKLREIRPFAFDGCTALQEIRIPPEIREIWGTAFSHSGLTHLELPPVRCINIAAFAGCKSLESVTIAEGTQLIDRLAFNNCTALRHVTLPESVVMIDAGAFGLDTALTGLQIRSYVQVHDSALRHVGGIRMEWNGHVYAFAPGDEPTETLRRRISGELYGEMSDSMLTAMLHAGHRGAAEWIREHRDYIARRITAGDIQAVELVMQYPGMFDRTSLDESIQLAIEQEQYEIQAMLMRFKNETPGLYEGTADDLRL